MAQRKGLYYGWIIVAAGFSINLVNTGFLVYTFSLFAAPVSRELGASRTQVLLASSLYTLAIAVFSPMVGAQMEKGRLKPVLVFGALLAGFGFIAMGAVSGLYMFYAMYIVIGIGLAFAGPAIHTALPALWFDKRRGLAVGIVNGGAGLGAIVAPAIVMYFSAHYSWRIAYAVLGVLTMAILIPLALFVVRTRPQDMGLLPDGAAPEEPRDAGGGARREAVGLTRAEALRTPAFWILAASLFFLGFTQIGVLQNQASHLASIDFDMAVAAGALGVIGLMSTVSKIGYGWVVDKIGFKRTVVLGNLPLIAGVLMLSFARPGYSSAYMYVYALLFGIGLGAWVPVASVAIGRVLGVKFFGSIWGALFAFRTIGDIVSVPVLSSLADIFGGYAIPLQIAAFLGVISTILTVMLKRPEACGKPPDSAAERRDGTGPGNARD